MIEEYGYPDLFGSTDRRTQMEQRRKAPWPDYAGRPIYEGDTVEHPSGDRGIVRFFEAYESQSDQWRVDYGDLPIALRLCLQIGDKGRAVVVLP